MSGKRIVLTSDETMMSTYHGGVLLGFTAIMPVAVMPDWIFRWLFCPTSPANPDGSSKLAPCGMRKVEASLLESGFSREEVMVAHPFHLDKAIGPDTTVLGITHDDPLGRIAVREIEEVIDRGPPHNRTKFLALLNHPLIKKYRPRIVVGGNGAWELKGEDVGVDHIYLGEGESDFPEICRRIMRGEDVPPVICGNAVPGEDIPVNHGATIAGIVEIGRGCWRGCAFCSPTMRSLRHRPLEKILKDVKVNQEAGFQHVLLHSEDVFSFGSPGMEVDQERVLRLFREVRALDPATIDVSHLSLATVHRNQDLLREISRTVELGSRQQYMSAWVGIETASCRVLQMHMPRKALPGRLERWPQMVRECYQLFSEEGWLPVASLVLGLPGETASDVVETTELVEELMDHPGLMLPLFFTPMSETLLGGVKGFGKEDALPEHWQLVGTCMDYNLRHLKRLHRLYSERMSAGPGVHLALRAINLLADRVLNTYMKRMKRGEPPN